MTATITTVASDRHYDYVVVHGVRTAPPIAAGVRVALSYLNTVEGALAAVRALHPDVVVESVTHYAGEEPKGRFDGYPVP